MSAQNAGRREWGPFFPFSIGAYLCATLWLQRTGGSATLGRDLVGSVIALLVVSEVGALLSGLITKDVHRRALIALLLVLWAALFGSFQVLLAAYGGSFFTAGALALVLWTALLAGAVRAVLRAPWRFDRVSRALNIASVLLLVLLLPRLAQLWRAEPAPATATWRGARDDAHPDIYLVVLDKYTSGTWLAQNYGLDHTPVEDSLRALGFRVPTGARTNYTHTKLVLTSMLEGRLLDTAVTGSDRAAYDALTTRIVNAPLWTDLKARGYRLVFFPSSFEGTRELPLADLTLAPPQPSAERWAETFVVNSPLVVLLPVRCALFECEPASASPYPLESLRAVDWKLRTLESLPDSAGPVAAFLHLLVPHEPYLFADDCSPRAPWWPLTDLPPTSDDSLRSAYAAQVKCLDRRLLATVTELLRRSSRPPVIILVGDHGNGRFARDVLRGFTLELDELTPEQLGERFGVFVAARFPGADSLIADEFTLVNLVPTLRHSLWGEPLRLQPNQSYWSTYQRALEFTALEQARLRPASTR